MRVEIDPDARPVEARRDLLDVRRFAGAVIALHHHPAIMREARADRERGIGIEDIGRIEIGHTLVRLAERGALHVAVAPEQLEQLDHLFGQVGRSAFWERWGAYV